MSELHVRNLPPDVHAALRERARVEGRSMSSAAVIILRAALTGAERPDRRRMAIDALAELRDRNRLPADAAGAAELVREDRDGRGAPG
ncbi:MAG: FitA-like ribbon-helix-helix domain-containing protein [Sporichthyaceae bacterium]